MITSGELNEQWSVPSLWLMFANYFNIGATWAIVPDEMQLGS